MPPIYEKRRRENGKSNTRINGKCLLIGTGDTDIEMGDGLVTENWT